MNQNDSHAVRQVVVKARAHGADLRTRATEAFDAVGRRHGEEHMACIIGADADYIRCKLLALTAAFRMDVVFGLVAKRPACLQELRASLRIGG